LKRKGWYADRARYLGDPDYTRVPVRELTDLQYLLERMNRFDPSHAGKSSDTRAGYIPGYESEATTHYSIVDEEGNAVAGTTTLNWLYGSKIVIPGTGILLNNQMDDFSIKAGIPNSYGLTGGVANAVQPGKRMLSSMTPTIVEKDKSLFMVVGTPGGSTIITSVLQTILNITEHGMSMQEAVSGSRFHHQWLPDVVYYERHGLDSLVLAELAAMGYLLQQRGPIGRVDAILVLPDGSLEGGADPRGDDKAMGY
jgi:gamma-glutamyltranspeptidase/glutathione hydrolase